PQEEICIIPVSEVILNNSTKLQAINAIDSPALKNNISGRLRKIVKNKITEGGHFSGISFLLDLFYDSSGTILQYLPPDTIVYFYELTDWEQKISDYGKKVTEKLAVAQQEERISSLGVSFYFSPEETQRALLSFPQVIVEPLEIVFAEEKCFAFSVSDHRTLLPEIIADKSRTRPFAKLVEKIAECLNNYFSVVIVVYSEIQIKRVWELLQAYNLPVSLSQEPTAHPSFFPGKGTLVLTLGEIQKGFFSPADRVIILTEGEIFGEKFAYWKKPEPIEGEPVFSLDDLQVDDFIVHVDYGIGQYKGLYSLEVGGNKNDFLLIEYRDQDRLYVPAFRLNLIQKYRSGEEEAVPILNKLGSKAWANTKAKVKKTIMAHAKELLRIYAARQALEGFSFAPRDQLYQEVEAQFEYEETHDQLKAIEDVLRDMENPRPMDRLICGDVGYGKTEVALRASFKAVMNNKQVAVLVPTTILAYQHYQTFIYRFRNFPITVAMLSRFQSPSEHKNIVAQLKQGTIDIVIGTHRLLQNDVEFKDLGLVIIDEEHRFGVRHKEKFKKLRMLVD
ncbi:MAG: DEAD/DEAH box helicase, partial [Desulfobacterota bacterium]|nr:DEAD/DEAH box helicase [Thermodesulfobacteriota bacterium]